MFSKCSDTDDAIPSHTFDCDEEDQIIESTRYESGSDGKQTFAAFKGQTVDSIRSDVKIAATVKAKRSRDFGYYPRHHFKEVDRNAPLIRCAVTIPNIARQIANLAAEDRNQNLNFGEDAYSYWKYARLITTADHFLVLHVDHKLAGFLLAYGSEIKHYEGFEDKFASKIKEMVGGEKFVCIKHLCIARNDDSQKTRRYAALLWKALYARTMHFYDNEPGVPRRIFVKKAQGVIGNFLESVGFHRCPLKQEEETGAPIDDILVLEGGNVRQYLKKITNITESENHPFYDNVAMMDPNCIGIGVGIYAISPPGVKGNFDANIRIVMKWRHLGIEESYQRIIHDGFTRTSIETDLENHPAVKKRIRCPRFDFNKDEFQVTESYAYIDKNDPQDVITWHKVLRGTFSGELQSIRYFPADLQELRFTFRMWDNDPDDRCRYFRQLSHFSNIPWTSGVLRKVDSLEYNFFAPKAEIDVFYSGASRYIFKIPCIRRTPYFLRTIAYPVILITSLSAAGISIETYGLNVDFNASLLLATVAYVFINKDITPKGEITLLDIITFGSLSLNWALVMIRYLVGFEDVEIKISIIICGVTVGLQVVLSLFLFLRYRYHIRKLAPLVYENKVPFQRQEDEFQCHNDGDIEFASFGNDEHDGNDDCPYWA